MIGRPQSPEQPGRLRRQPLNENRPAPRQESGDPGVAYLRPDFLQHDPTSFDRRAPPGTKSGRKEKAPSVSGGALETACMRRLAQRKRTSFGPALSMRAASGKQVSDIKICTTWFMRASLREVGRPVKRRF